MSELWTAEEFRRVRIALVGASLLGWVLWLAAPWRLVPAESAEHVVERALASVCLAGAIHLVLLVSLAAERGNAVSRVVGGLLVTGVLLMIAAAIAFLFSDPFWANAAPHLVALSWLAALHLVQLWRMTALPFPRVAPLVSDDATLGARGCEPIHGG